MIGLLIPTLAGGGAERVASLLSKGLHELGKEVAVVVFERKVGYHYSGELISLDMPYTSPAKELWRMPRRARKLKEVAKAHGIEKVISFDEVANFTAILSGIPTIATIHRDLERADREKGITHHLLRAMRRLYQKAGNVIVPSREMAEKLSHYIGVKINVIANPIPSPPSIKQLGDIHLNIGRLTHQKGQWHLIHTYKKLPYTLYIHGKGPLEAKLKKLVGDTANIHISTEWVDNIYTLYSKARINLQTSYYEGFGMVLAEGLSVGLPAVATNVPYGPAEVLGEEREKLGDLSVREGGILLPPPPNTWEEHPFHQTVREAVSLLAEDEDLWKKLSSKGRKRAESWHYKRIAKEWLRYL